MTNGFIITPEGEFKDFTAEFKLSTIYSEMNAMDIEIINIGEGISVYIDGEGHLKKTNPNIYGTAVAEALGGWRRMQLLHGSLLFFGGFDEEGSELPLTEEQYSRLIGLLNRTRGW